MSTATLTELVDGVVKLVGHGDATMGQVQRYAERRGMNTRGGLDVTIAPNVIIAPEVSEEFADLVNAIRADGRLMPAPADVLVLMYEGDALYGLPIAKRIEGGYKKPHWLPVRFVLRPEASG